ncbi:AAA family ATPase [Anaerobacillus sp. 1_MG-2023]|uniref:AAA family ATPase n=1 Tax=Anaerobacillus sp. 1_MG-2023 TaxID=3062655 RepID=UPI0026E13E48|nr:AAA family ATPase [Anaerobacillus sp. 1_MG-2023]MDO6658655.1 AAA family ATPase [Anaerobacillus sp. 1_MG-2023]
MELTYTYIQKYRNLEDLSLTFSNRFSITYQNDEIKIENNNQEFNVFKNKVNNITSIVGKNGTGKTNIIDLLGMRMDDRKRECMYEKHKYFILYHIGDNEFVIEGVGRDLIKDIVNIPNGCSEAYSMIVKYTNKKFSFCNYLQLEKEEFSKLNYLNIRSFFRKGYKNLFSFQKEPDYTGYFHRYNINSNTIPFTEKYNLIQGLHENSNIEEIFKTGKKIEVKIKPEISYETRLNLKPEGTFLLKYLRQNSNKPNNKTIFIRSTIEKYLHFSYETYLKIISDNKDLSFEKLNQEITDEIHMISYKTGQELEYYFTILRLIMDKIGPFDDKESVELYYSAFKEFINVTQQLDEKYFTENQIVSPITNKQDTNFYKLLRCIEHYVNHDRNYLNNILSINFEPTSSGEEAFINLLSSISSGLNLQFLKESKKVIILLDEPDNFMHPEWSRRLISILISFLNTTELDCYFHIIITTHSPFILSDLPKENIISLIEDENSSKIISYQLEDIDQTFASNIHTLFSKSFFMNSTIGEFAKYNIDSVINRLNSNKPVTEKEQEEISGIISLIGEPLIRNKLKEMYIDKLDHYSRRKKEKEILEKIKQYEKELRWIGENDKDL